MLRTHPDKLVSCSLLVPTLIFIFRHPESPFLGYALDTILPLAPTVARLIPYLPAGGYWDIKPVFMVPRPTTSRFVPCQDGAPNWRCPNCGGHNGHWYVEEFVRGECMTNALEEDEHTWLSQGWDGAQV